MHGNARGFTGIYGEGLSSEYPKSAQSLSYSGIGRVAEWTNAAVLKTAGPGNGSRGFESLPFRHSGKGRAVSPPPSLLDDPAAGAIEEALEIPWTLGLGGRLDLFINRPLVGGTLLGMENTGGGRKIRVHKLGK